MLIDVNRRDRDRTECIDTPVVAEFETGGRVEVVALRAAFYGRGDVFHMFKPSLQEPPFRVAANQKAWLPARWTK
jgi:hypothetical protein